MNIRDDFVLKNFHEGYLVGGSLRDFFMGKTTCDRDITIKNADLFAQKLAKEFDGTLVTLDSENKIYRVVLSDKINYLDISEMQGNCIEDDLKRRDFTINAIAYNLAEQEFMFMFMGSLYYVHYPDFKVRHENLETETSAYYPLEEDIYAKILVLRYLLNASVFPHNGEFRSYKELPSGNLYARQFQGRYISRMNHKFGSRLEKFKEIMECIGAVPVHPGDIGYELELFEELYLRFIFWEGDEEFQASSQILFSSNFPAAFGTYDLAEIGEICINTFCAIEKQL